MRKKRTPPAVQAGAMADIAFLLLLFFLVATTIVSEKGIQVLLPKYVPDEPTPISQERIVHIKINGYNEVIFNQQIISVSSLGRLLKVELNERFAAKSQPIVSFQTDRETSYASYIEAYDQIRAAYNELRNEYAINRWNTAYELLDKSDWSIVNKEVPMIISEAEVVSLVEAR
jgi:biopolymer transport protein ExbD